MHKEGRRVRLETLNKIAIQSRGDVRAALNDLESVLELGEEAVIEVINEREKQSSIFDALKTVFQGPSNEETLRIFDDTQMQLDEILLWVEENIPLEYQNEALAKAYEALSRADIFKGRIYRQQYWRFLVYQSFFLSGGISAASKEKRSNFVSYKKPSRILKIWMANMKNAKSKAIVEKYASFCHMSKKKAMKEKFLLPFILDELDSKTRKKMDLDEAEIDYLLEKKGGVIVAGSLNRFRE